jgi:hypothetical protein
MSNEMERNWEALFSEQERSGVTVSAFCSERGLNYHSFKNRKTHWNRRRLEGASSRQSGRAGEFVEVVPENKSTLKVWLMNGRMLEVASNFQEASLRRLIGVLESC